MKRVTFLLVSLCLCAFLTACEASDPENLFEMPLETTQTAATTAPVAAVEEGYYQYGNMQCSGNFMRYGDEIIFRSIPNGQFLLYTYNMSTGKVSFLCKDATCTHTTETTCLSNKALNNLEQYQGKFYANSYDLVLNSDNYSGLIWSQIIELQNDHFEKTIDGIVIGFWHGNGNLYVRTADKSLLAYENGSDTPRVLLDEYTNALNVVFGQYLYSFNDFNKTLSRVDLLAENPCEEILLENCDGVVDGQYVYYVDEKDDYHLYRCNMDGSDPELFLEQTVYANSMNFDDEYLYFRLFKPDDMFGEGSHDLYRMPKDGSGGMEKIAELPETVASVWTVPGYDKIFVDVRILQENGNAIYPSYVMNNDGSDMKLLELPDY